MGRLTVSRLKDPLNKWATQKHSQIPPNAIKQKQTLRIQKTHRLTNQKIIRHIYFHSLVRTDMSTPPAPAAQKQVRPRLGVWVLLTCPSRSPITDLEPSLLQKGNISFQWLPVAPDHLWQAPHTSFTIGVLIPFHPVRTVIYWPVKQSWLASKAFSLRTGVKLRPKKVGIKISLN